MLENWRRVNLSVRFEGLGLSAQPAPNPPLAATARQLRAPRARTALNASLRVQNGRSEPRALSPFAKQLLTKNLHRKRLVLPMRISKKLDN